MGRPRLTLDEAVEAAATGFGFRGRASELPSDRDQNFLLTSPDGERRVLKLANTAERRESLDLQVAALAHLRRRLPGLTWPRHFPSRSGTPVAEVRSALGDEHFVRLVGYVDGAPLSKISPRSPALLRAIGRLLGTMDLALRDFEHPALGRALDWDLRRAPAVVNARLGEIGDAPGREMVARMVEAFESEAGESSLKLRTSAIHSDANDDNLIVLGSPSGEPGVALVDFGDMLRSWTVAEPAIAAAYASLGKEDPLAPAVEVVAGYDSVLPLEDAEIHSMFHLIRLRLCVSVAMSASQSRLEPGVEYLRVSEAAAWETLRRLDKVEPAEAERRFREACIGSGSLVAGSLMRTEDLAVLRKALIAPSLGLSYERALHIVRGRAQYLYDADGRAYLDAANNVASVGHSHPRVVEAVSRQYALLNTNTRYLHENLVRYCQRLVELLPKPLEVCIVVNSGSEANDLALRLARTYIGSKETIVLDGAYHGNLTSLIEISPYKFDGPGGSGAPPFVRKVPTPDPYRGKYRRDDPRAGERYADELSRTLERLGTPATFIAEPLMGVAGQIVPPAGFLKTAFDRVRDAGGVCIADEVQVGFARMGTHFWGFETQSAIPDIVTMGKPAGDGHPLAAVVTTREIAAAFANGMEYFNTYGGNPVSCAAGLAVLDVIRDERLQENALRVGTILKSDIEALAKRHPIIGDVRGIGLFLGVELVRDRGALEPATAETAEVVERMKDEGVLVGRDGPNRNVVKIKPPLVFDEEAAATLVSALDSALSPLSSSHNGSSSTATPLATAASSPTASRPLVPGQPR